MTASTRPTLFLTLGRVGVAAGDVPMFALMVHSFKFRGVAGRRPGSNNIAGRPSGRIGRESHPPGKMPGSTGGPPDAHRAVTRHYQGMTVEAAPIRGLVADDHLVVRRGIGALLASLPGVEVVAEAINGADALREAQLARPDVVIMDIQMPVMDGIEATRRLATLLPEVAVLVLTMFEDDESVLSAMRAGARGYLLKGAQQQDILAAIRSVVAGQFVVGPGAPARSIKLPGAPPPPGPSAARRRRLRRAVLRRTVRCFCMDGRLGSRRGGRLRCRRLCGHDC